MQKKITVSLRFLIICCVAEVILFSAIGALAISSTVKLSKGASTNIGKPMPTDSVVVNGKTWYYKRVGGDVVCDTVKENVLDGR